MRTIRSTGHPAPSLAARRTCPGTYVLPSGLTTGAKGEPDANTAVPRDQSIASCAVHSDLDVGLDSANTRGAACAAAIASTTACVKAAGCAETPMSAVGRSAATTASRTAPGATAAAAAAAPPWQPFAGGHAWAYGLPRASGGGGG